MDRERRATARTAARPGPATADPVAGTERPTGPQDACPMRVHKRFATALPGLALALGALTVGAAPPSYNPPAGGSDGSSLFPPSYAPPRPAAPAVDPRPVPRPRPKPGTAPTQA